MKKVLMVDPEFFDVVYAINAHMTDASGQLNKVDRPLAKKQWQDLRATYQELGFQVDVLPGVKNLPDMVFTANQSFPYLDTRTGERSVILSNMRSEFRRPEVAFFESYYREQGYQIHKLNSGLAFEGNGDALLHPGRRLVWGGYGFRTDKAVYKEVREISGFEVQPLELKHPEFYHLDTCFSILNETSVALVPEAFQPADLDVICSHFSTVIEIDLIEATKYFAGNCHSPDGKHVILHPGSGRFVSRLKDLGFVPVERGTSEYIKSGGSVFCLKMMLP